MKTKIGAIFAIFISISMLALPTRADQPFMRAAQENLEDALKSLKKATADKGGHRENAISITSQAITSVKNGISYDQQNPNDRRRRNNTENEFSPVNYNNFDQPNMVKARESLQSALANLRKASADKGGYREQAMNLINNAITEVNRGIEYDRNH
ncbi:MAG TPA: hypothetical protein PKE69_07385 [Pyrinomonadaceae bacterium]|nr:hypothetical protein [Pyrinomonadaceae bacterium]